MSVGLWTRDCTVGAASNGILAADRGGRVIGTSHGGIQWLRASQEAKKNWRRGLGGPWGRNNRGISSKTIGRPSSDRRRPLCRAEMDAGLNRLCSCWSLPAAAIVRRHVPRASRLKSHGDPSRTSPFPPLSLPSLSVQVSTRAHVEIASEFAISLAVSSTPVPSNLPRDCVLASRPRD